jgi:hypothetical protein
MATVFGDWFAFAIARNMRLNRYEVRRCKTW